MKRLVFIGLLLLTAVATEAGTFTGKVNYRRANGSLEPLPFAQIYHLEKKQLLTADADGRFTLDLDATATLVATYVGYTKDTLVVTPDITSAEFYLSGENEVSQAVVTARQEGISKMKPIKTEIISSAGLCKMACCALASSFENSSSVTVGYADAITGAKQIKLLGLSGTYTQLLDENRPTMRGLAAPFGLSFIPGQWLESIQISKGPTSVTNGIEAITGQINLEQRKPTDETPLFVQAYIGSDAMVEANIASALQIGDRWSTITQAHVGSTFASMDHNRDNFRDDPQNLQLSISNRWLYYAPSGLQVRFGARYINDDRLGGQMNARKDNGWNLDNKIWGSRIQNRNFNGYAKVGMPITSEGNSNVAMILDYTHHELDGFWGLKDYTGRQDNFFANLLYSHEFNDHHKMELGVTFNTDNYRETLVNIGYDRNNFDHIESYIAAFGEYTFTLEDKLTFVGGLNFEYNWIHGFKFVPRGSFKYSFTDAIVLRLVGGRGCRCSNFLTDNLGIFSASRLIKVAENLDPMEDAWTVGANMTFYLPFGYEPENTYLSFDFFRNDFKKQVIVDQEVEYGYTNIYNLNGPSYTNTYQVDFNVEPIERFNIVATFKYTDAKVTMAGQGLKERLMTSRFKGVLNLQYATRMSKWIFDFTAQINGPMRLPYFAYDAWKMDYSPVYPTLYAQVTRKFKGFDVYVGGENLTNFKQKNPIIDATDPFSKKFNAGCVWGPLTGIKVYAGVRYTLWKM